MDAMITFPDITNTLQLIGCHFGVKPPDWEYPKHHHHFYELLYCEEGNITQEIDGAVFRLGKGDWLLINAGARHLTRNHSDSHYIFFNTHFDLDDMEVRKLLSRASFSFITSKEAENSKLPHYMKELEDLMQRSLVYDKAYAAVHGAEAHEEPKARLNLAFVDRISLQAHILLIIKEFLFLSRHQKATDPASSHSSSPYTTDIAHAIEERLARNILEDISITDIAKELYLSRYQCTKIFTQVYGISPRQYVSRLKQNKAKELLLNTDMTIQAIAHELGFNSIQHFSRQFRRWTNQSPTQFRPKHAAPDSIRRPQESP